MAENIPAQVFLRGEGGVVTAHDIPLHWAIEKRLTKGYLVRVANAAGDHYEPASADEVGAAPVERPAINASKSAWVAWAVAESKRRGEPISADTADASTKQDLIEKYGTEPKAEVPAPEQSEESETPAEAEVPAPEQ